MRIGAALACMVLSSAANAAAFSVDVVGPATSMARMKGKMSPGDAARLEDLIGVEARSGRRVVALSVDSPGGNLWEGFEIARSIRLRSMAVLVTDDRACVSSCFTILALAPEAFASPNATVAVHRPSRKGRMDEASDVSAMRMAAVYRVAGVPLGVIGAALTTPAERAYVLRRSELAAMGVRVTADGRPPSDWTPREPSRDRDPWRGMEKPLDELRDYVGSDGSSDAMSVDEGRGVALLALAAIGLAWVARWPTRYLRRRAYSGAVRSGREDAPSAR